MSYGRFNNTDSDIYLYASGSGLILMVSKDARLPETIDRSYMFEWELGQIRARKICIEYLMTLRDDFNIKVPQRTFDRLLREIGEHEGRTDSGGESPSS